MKLKNLAGFPGFGPFQICADGKDLIFACVDPAMFFAKRYVGFGYTFADAKEGEIFSDWGQRHREMSKVFPVILTAAQWKAILRKP